MRFNSNLFVANSQFYVFAFDRNSRTSGSVIPEENVDEFWSTADGNHMDAGVAGSNSSLSLSMHLSGVTTTLTDTNQGTNNIRRGSPVPSYSPYGNSPAGDHANSSGYMMMSPCIDFNRG